MVPQRNEISLNAIRNAQQKLAPSIARPLLEVRGRSRRVEPVSALDDQLDPKPRAHRTHELFIAIRLSTANPMVQMRGRRFEALERSRSSSSAQVSATESAPPDSPTRKDEPPAHTRAQERSLNRATTFF